MNTINKFGQQYQTVKTQGNHTHVFRQEEYNTKRCVTCGKLRKGRIY